MRFFYGSIRKKLIILVLLATAPVFVVLLTMELINREQALMKAQDKTMMVLHGFAEVQRKITDSTANLLRTIASMPDIQAFNQEGSSVILTTLLESNPIYENVLLVKRSGDLVSAGKYRQTLNLSELASADFVQEAMRKNTFTSGTFTPDSLFVEKIFPFAVAVSGPDGLVHGALIIGIDLSHYQKLFDRGNYPAGSFIGLCDKNGLRLFRYPAVEKILLGKPIVPEVFDVIQRSQQSDALIATGADGVQRIVAFEPFHLEGGDEPYMFMFMGFDHDTVMHEALGLSRLTMLLGGLSIALALLIAWFVGTRVIAGDIEKLTKATQNFSGGDAHVISGIDYTDGEIGILAESFDRMVKLLHEREQERDRVETSLRASERRFRKILEKVSAIAIQGYDEQRRVIYWNKASEEIYGYSRNEAMGRKLEELIIPEEMCEEVVRLHGRWLHHGEQIPPGELLLRDKSGNEVPVYSSHAMDETGSGKEMYCIDIDLRPLKRSEADIKELQAQLFQAQKMESIGTLAGGIAHDFNNILSSILGFTELALQDSRKGSEQEENLLEVLAAGNRAKDLVRQILACARQADAELKPIRIGALIEDVLKLLRPSTPVTITIISDLKSNALVLANSSQLHQVVLNLCTNAVQAMQHGGVLKLGLYDRQSEEEHNLPDTLEGSRDYVELTVEDNGPGIDPAIIDKIFEPYFTTKEVGQGSGMGLAVAKGIAETCGGDIQVSSSPGEKTVFSLRLPITSTMAPEKTDEQARIIAGSEHLLLVDDEPQITKMSSQLLQKLGYRVTSSTSSYEALELFRENAQEFDLVLTDMTMPSLTGDKLAVEMRKIRSDIPIIICTGYSCEMNEVEAKNLGINAFAYKPFTTEDLARTIRLVLDSA